VEVKVVVAIEPLSSRHAEQLLVLSDEFAEPLNIVSGSIELRLVGDERRVCKTAALHLCVNCRLRDADATLV
jgi:hypothetical protein